MVGIRSFPFGMAYFQVGTVSFREGKLAKVKKKTNIWVNQKYEVVLKVQKFLNDQSIITRIMLK